MQFVVNQVGIYVLYYNRLITSLTLLNTVKIMTRAGKSINALDRSSHELILAVKSKERERVLHLFFWQEERWATRG